MRKFVRAFGYAWEGVLHGLKTERNIKFHFFAAIIVIIASFLTRISFMEWLVVILLIGGMISLEMINSAIERTIDLVTTDVQPLAKQAKDLAAGAVLIYAVASAVIGLLIFLPKWL